MKELLKKWETLDPKRKQQIILGLIILVFIVVIYSYASSNDRLLKQRRVTKSQNISTDILTGHDTSNLGIEGNQVQIKKIRSDQSRFNSSFESFKVKIEEDLAKQDTKLLQSKIIQMSAEQKQIERQMKDQLDAIVDIRDSLNQQGLAIIESEKSSDEIIPKVEDPTVWKKRESTPFDDNEIPGNETANKENAFCKKGITELLSLLKIIEGYGAYIDFERVNGIIEHGIEKQDMDALKTWGYNNRYPLSGLMAEAERLSIDNLTTAGRRRLDVMLKFIAGFTRHISGLTVKDKLIFLSKQARNANRLKSDPKIHEAFDHVIRVADSFGENTSGFLETAALQSDPDIVDTQSQKVSLMTIHAAKGLEFPVVFIAGCENGLIPFIRNSTASCDMDEERRLFYVAMTRAKEHLIFTRAKKRTIYGKTDTRDISPFVADIENKLLDNDSPDLVKKKKKQIQMTLF